MRKLGIRRKIARAVVGLLLLPAAILLGVLHLPVVQSRVFQFLASRALRSGGIVIEATGFRYNLLLGSAELRDLKIRNARHPEMESVARIPAVTLHFHPFQVTRGLQAVQSIHLQNPAVSIEYAADGESNLPGAGASTPFDWSSLPAEILVAGGSLHLRDAAKAWDLRIPGVTMKVRQVDGGRDMTLTTGEPGSLQWQRDSLRVQEIRFSGRLVSSDLEVRNLEARTSNSRFTARGWVHRLSSPILELSLTSQWDLADVSGLVSRGNPITGNLAVEAEIAGPFRQASADLEARFSELRVAALEPLSGTATVRYQPSPSAVILEDLQANSALGAFSAEGSLSFSEEGSEGRLSANLKSVSLAGAMASLAWDPHLEARVSGPVSFSWKNLDWQTATGNARFTLAPRGSDPISLSGSVALDLDARNLQMHVPSLSGPGFRLTADLQTNRSLEGLRGRVIGQIGDATALLDAARRTWPKPMSRVGIPVAGSLRWNAQLGGSLRAPRIVAGIETADFRAGSFGGIGFDGTAEYAAGRLRLHDSSLLWRDQRVRIVGEMDLTAAESPAFDMQARLENASLQEVLAGFGLGLRAEGRVNADVTGSGSLAQPEFEASMRGTGLSAYGEPFGSLNARARFSGSRITVDSLSLEKPQQGAPGLAEGHGTLDWGADLLDFQIRSNAIAIESMTLPDRIPVRGSMSLEATASGSLSKPAWSVGLDARALSVAGRSIGDMGGSIHGSGASGAVELAFPGYAATLKSEIGLTPPYPVQLVIDSTRLDFALLRVILSDGTPLDGSVTMHAEAAGTLTRPLEAAAKVSLQNLEAGVGEFSIRSRSSLEAEWKNQTLILHPSVMESEAGEWRIGGELPLQATGSTGEVTVNGGLPLSLIAHLLPSARDVDIRGITQIHGSLRGSLRRIQPSLEITTREAELRIPGMAAPLTDILIEADADADRIEVRRMEAMLQNGSIHARGTFPLPMLSGSEAAAPMRAEIEVTGMNPAAVLEDFGTLAGSIGAEVVLEAPRLDLSSLRGTLVFPELRLKGQSTEVEQSGATRLKIEDGQLTVEHLVLKGQGGVSLETSGWVSLMEDHAVNLRINGGMHAELLSAGRKEYGLDGLIQTKLEISGSLRNPRLNGVGDLSAGRFSLASPPLSVAELSAHAEFADSRITITHLTGQLNGGSFEAEGSASFSQGVLGDLRGKAVAENVFLDYPKGLRTVSNLDLSVHSEKDLFLIEGTVHIGEGLYREAIDLVSLQKGLAPGTGERSTLLDRMIFNVRLQTESPVAVDNNLARLDANADLRVVGPASRPSLMGRLELDEGGRVYAAERTFTIARATVNFTNEKRIEPHLDLSAQTRIGEYEVILNASGGFRDLEASFTADPVASQDQIESLLLTGSPDNADRISSGTLVSRSALSLFGSTAVGGFNMRVRKALGFSDFRIEPSLISADSDPTARLTVGQNLTPELSLTYSTNLRNSNDQIWIAEYDWRRNLIARYLNRSEDTDRVEIRHRLRFGGGPDTGDPRSAHRAGNTRLESVEITGNLAFPEDVIRKELNLKPGQRFDFIGAQKQIEKLIRFYGRSGYLETTIRQHRSTNQDNVTLKLEITAGRHVSFLFEGAEVPRTLRQKVEKAWLSGLADSERLRETAALIRQHFFHDRYCDAEVSVASETEQESEKIVTCRIVPGRRYDRLGLEFPGLSDGLAGKLGDTLRRYDLELQIQSDPAEVRRILLNQLREYGYLTAEVSLPQVRRNQEEGTYASVIPVQPGPRYLLGKALFEGNRVVSSADLIKALELQPGEPYTPGQLDLLAQSLGTVYWRKGYRDATAEAVERPNPTSGLVDLIFKIKENSPAAIAGVEITGNVETSEEFLLRRIPFRTGDTVDGDKLDLLRRRLVGSGSYDTVDITLPPAGQAAPQAQAQPLELMVRVREPKPFTLVYGLTYDTTRKAGFLFDAGTRNVLGEGRLLGYRIIADKEKIDQRIYYTQPFLGRFDIVTNADMGQENSIIENLYTLKRSLTIQQQVEFRKKFTFSYGYRIQQTETDIPDTHLGSIPSSETTSPLISALTRDTRDDVFDATRGSYISQAFEYGPTILGGNIPYYRYFGQYFRYFGLTRPATAPFSDGRRSRVVFATGVRLGLMDALENREFTPGDRFFGGGSTSIRGYRQNSLGPLLEDGQPIGGQAALFLNNELRTPFYKWLDAAFFLDIGNVFEKPSDFSLSDLRKSAGIGLRLRNPFVMLRFDFGWKLDRRSGESRGAFHFGIGQAF